MEALQWQAQQASREAEQLRRTPSAAADAAAPMDADAPGGSQGGSPTAAGASQQQAAGGAARPQASLASSEAGSAVGAERQPSTSSLPAAADAAAAAGAADAAELPPGVAAAAAAAGLVPPEQGGPAGAPGMYGSAPAHEEFDELLAAFQEQVGGWVAGGLVGEGCGVGARPAPSAGCCHMALQTCRLRPVPAPASAPAGLPHARLPGGAPAAHARPRQ